MSEKPFNEKRCLIRFFLFKFFQNKEFQFFAGVENTYTNKSK